MGESIKMWLLKFLSEYGPSIKKKQTNKQTDKEEVNATIGEL